MAHYFAAESVWQCFCII